MPVTNQGPRLLATAAVCLALDGAGLVRAGVLASWAVGDKSGTAAYGTRNDVAVVHPPGREPWVVVVLTSQHDAHAETDDALVAQATRVVVLGGTAVIEVGR